MLLVIKLKKTTSIEQEQENYKVFSQLTQFYPTAISSTLVIYFPGEVVKPGMMEMEMETEMEMEIHSSLSLTVP